MARYQCSVCGDVYQEANQGTAWDELPHDWVCPACGASRAAFSPAGSPAAGVPAGFPANFRLAHRWLGYAFVAIYLLMLWQMVPRLWTYQIEFPPRTVVQIVLGIAIGTVLLLKILLVRFFPTLDASLVPRLGISLLVSARVLIGISTPFALRRGRRDSGVRIQVFAMPPDIAGGHVPADFGGSRAGFGNADGG